MKATIKQLNKEGQIEKFVKEMNGRASARLLDESDVKCFLSKHAEFKKHLQSWNLPTSKIEGYSDGGGVCNSYRNRAETSIIKSTGETIIGSRGTAKSAAYGNTISFYMRYPTEHLSPAKKKEMKAVLRLKSQRKYLYLADFQ